MRRCASTCNGVGGCGRLAGEGGALGDEDFHHQSPPTATARLERRRRSDDVTASDRRAPLGLLHSIWRIRTRGLVDLVMIDRAFMARLWKNFRSAVHEFKISRMQKRSNERFRVVEVSKCERRRRFSSSGCRPPLSTRCHHLKRSARRRAAGAAAVVGCPRGPTNTNAGCGLISSAEDSEEEQDTEEESVTDESALINWTRWKEIEIGEFCPRVEIVAISSSKSMEEFGSLKWEEGFLTATASTRFAPQLEESSSVASTTGFEHSGWENRYRVSNTSPLLLQPVRGKLTTLSSLLRTMSDRYARRTGNLTPLHDRSSNNNNDKRPVLTQSQSAAPWPMQKQQNHHRSNSTSRIVDDVPAKRYDNPFQDFLRQSFAERHSRSVHGTDRQR